MKRVRRPHGLLPKAPQTGDPITVVLGDEFVRASVRRLKTARLVYRGTVARPLHGTNLHSTHRIGGYVLRRDEGLTWARGWDTPAAGALRTFAALS